MPSPLLPSGRNSGTALLGSIILATLLFLCTNGSVYAQTAVQLQSGQLLSSACFQCHSENGFDNIIGESPSEIRSEMREMKMRRTPGSIMDLIARAYTDQQIQDISAYLATLSSANASSEDEDDD